jgi:hypothetical protein
MAVANTANSIGINRLNTGKISVPNPNPEKKVNIDTKNETTQMSKKKNISSINRIFNKNK